MKNFSEIEEIVNQLGLPNFRAKQIWNAIYKEGKSNFEDIKVLPSSIRRELSHLTSIYSINVVKTQISKDQETQKTLFELQDKQKIEAVLMSFKDGRNSICISSQAGCQMGCKFCATGTMKFGRNLTSEEISDQLLYFSQLLHKKKDKITNVVFMGMGEPFMNYDNVLKSIRTMNDKEGLNIGSRKITLSTSGICEGIDKLSTENIQVNLAISLHAPDQETRAKIMPIAKKYTITQLMNSINLYIAKTNRRVSYEYVMLKDINDSALQAKQLASLLKGQLCHVNLIPYNFTGITTMSGSQKTKINEFKEILQKEGINTTIRVTIGQDIDAACGQLANKSISN